MIDVNCTKKNLCGPSFFFNRRNFHTLLSALPDKHPRHLLAPQNLTAGPAQALVSLALIINIGIAYVLILAPTREVTVKYALLFLQLTPWAEFFLSLCVDCVFTQYLEAAVLGTLARNWPRTFASHSGYRIQSGEPIEANTEDDDKSEAGAWTPGSDGCEVCSEARWS